MIINNVFEFSFHRMYRISIRISCLRFFGTFSNIDTKMKLFFVRIVRTNSIRYLHGKLTKFYLMFFWVKKTFRSFRYFFYVPLISLRIFDKNFFLTRHLADEYYEISSQNTKFLYVCKASRCTLFAFSYFAFLSKIFSLKKLFIFTFCIVLQPIVI